MLLPVLLLLLLVLLLFGPDEAEDMEDGIIAPPIPFPLPLPNKEPDNMYELDDDDVGDSSISFEQVTPLTPTQSTNESNPSVEESANRNECSPLSRPFGVIGGLLPVPEPNVLKNDDIEGDDADECGLLLLLFIIPDCDIG